MRYQKRGFYLMLVFDPTTMNVTRFTLGRGLVNGGYYEMARAEILNS